jgi:outer membrane protein OmpA-like peptidoglycan-associated protein
MSLKKALLAATVIALPLSAQAQPVSGFYIGAGAGINWMSETDLTTKGPVANTFAGGTTTKGTAEFSAGWVGVLSLGYGFGNGVRAEVEGSYRQQGIDGVSGFPSVPRPLRTGGDVNSYGVMANVLYDFDLGPGSFLIPYIGAGIGYQVLDYSGVRVTGPAGNNITLDGDNGAFAWQGIVGAAFPIAAVPGLAVTLEYRYMASQTVDVDAIARNVNAVQPNTRGAVEVDNVNNSLLLGIRYAFGVTPPPPPPVVAPAAAPAPARTFLVFFDFDRADLTDRARQIIAEAATNTQRTGTTRIEVSGHADTVGTPQYNQALSVRRANAVAAELERRGVARSAMTIQGFGFTRPLVPTGPNVREPQNRRVEIVLR